MEKKFPIAIVVLVSLPVIFFVGLVIWAVTLRAGPVKNVSEISVSDFYGEQTISIKLKATDYAVLGHYSTFGYDGTLADISAAAAAMTDKSSVYKTAIINDVLLVTKITDDKTSYCAVKKLADSERYLITDMAAEVENLNDGFLFPYHFYISGGSEENSLYLLLSESVPIETSHGYDDWQRFYAALGRPEYVFDDANWTIDIGPIKIVFVSGRKAMLQAK